MGRTSAGIGVKTNTEGYSLDTIVETLFGNEFRRTNGNGDIRNNDWIVVSKTKEFIHIQKSDYAEHFFNDKLDASIETLNKLFN